MPKGIAKDQEHKAKLLRERMLLKNPMFNSETVKKVHTLRRKKQNYISWNKDTKGLQVAWNKDLRKETDERVAKYSNSMKGKIFTEITKQKIRVARSKQRFNKVSLEELAFIKFLKENGVNGIPQFNITGSNYTTDVDLFQQDHNLCIYYDGIRWHSLPGYPERDKRITEGLIRDGYKVIRISSVDFEEDPQLVLKRILEVE